jgi:aminoglycoside phosphotransferase (APT) family kinase protein
MTSNRRRAIAAATEVAAALGLAVEKAHVLQESNRLAVRLLPCDVLARVANEQESRWAEFELGLALRLAQSQAPIGVLEPRVTPDAYVHDGFVVTLWTYYETARSIASAPADYARALQRLHAEMRDIDMPTPHFTDRISEAQRLVGDRERTPALADADRDLLASTLQRLRQTVSNRSVPEQLLHGEPHPGNVLRTKGGLLFVDLQTCCRGPIEFDLAHVPEQVSTQYPRADQQLLHDCRLLMLAMVAAWRWDRNDQFPNGAQAAREYVSSLREALSDAPVSVPSLF